MLGLTLACIGAFAALVRAIAGPPAAVLAACILAAAFPLRAYHDANLAYNGMLQVVFLTLVASLAAWRRAVIARDPWAAVLAVALYAANGLTYEVSYLFFPLYACVVRPARSWPRALTGTWPFALTSLALAATSLWLRTQVRLDPGSDYSLNAHAAAYAPAFAKQLVAGLPLSYELFDPQRIFPSLRRIALLDAGPYAFRIPAALAFAVAVFALLGRRDAGTSGAREGSRFGAATALGLGLAVLPVPLVAASVKYQRELEWGFGYLPAFVQIFGTALLLAVAARAAKIPRALLAAALFVVADLTAGTNAIVGQALQSETASRAVVERAFARGLARDVPPGATIVLPSDLPWVCEDPLCPDGLSPRYLIYGLTGRRYTTVAPQDAAYANVTAFRLTYAAEPAAVRVVLERRGAAPSAALYTEAASGTWSLTAAGPRSALRPHRPDRSEEKLGTPAVHQPALFPGRPRKAVDRVRLRAVASVARQLRLTVAVLVVVPVLVHSSFLSGAALVGGAVPS